MKFPTLLKQSTLSFSKKMVRSPRLTVVSAILFVLLTLVSSYFFLPASSQNRPRKVTSGEMPTEPATATRPEEIVKVDVDLVTVDALVRLFKHRGLPMGDADELETAA